MNDRPIVGASGTGSISRRQARHAVKTVKMAKARTQMADNGTGSKRSQFVSPALVERYLGHFGSAPATQKNGTGVTKSPATKTTAKRSASK